MTQRKTILEAFKNYQTMTTKICSEVTGIHEYQCRAVMLKLEKDHLIFCIKSTFGQWSGGKIFSINKPRVEIPERHELMSAFYKKEWGDESTIKCIT